MSPAMKASRRKQLGGLNPIDVSVVTAERELSRAYEVADQVEICNGKVDSLTRNFADLHDSMTRSVSDLQTNVTQLLQRLDNNQSTLERRYLPSAPENTP